MICVAHVSRKPRTSFAVFAATCTRGPARSDVLPTRPDPRPGQPHCSTYPRGEKHLDTSPRVTLHIRRLLHVDSILSHSRRNRMGWRRPSQVLKSPMTLTRWASGAQTAKVVPSTPSMVRRCAPNRSNGLRCEPSARSQASRSPMIVEKRYGSSVSCTPPGQTTFRR